MTVQDLIDALALKVRVFDKDGWEIFLTSGKTLAYKDPSAKWMDSDVEEYAPFTFESNAYKYSEEDWLSFGREECSLQDSGVQSQSFYINCKTQKDLKFVNSILHRNGFKGGIDISCRSIMVMDDRTKIGRPKRVRQAGTRLKVFESNEPKWLDYLEAIGHKWPHVGDLMFVAEPDKSYSSFVVREVVAKEYQNLEKAQLQVLNKKTREEAIELVNYLNRQIRNFEATPPELRVHSRGDKAA